MIARARKLAQSNYGRRFGWYVEHDGDVVGELTDPVSEDMFWDSYTLTVTPASEHLVLDPAMWNGWRFRFRNKVLDEYAVNAFCGKTTPESLAGGSISMRGLYLQPRGIIERLVLAVSQWC